VNFAISTRGGQAGLDHLGFQTDSAEELLQLKDRAQNADMALIDEGETSCCYAQSDKHWITDPQGIAWEHFHTLGNIPVFNESALSSAAAACCAPAASSTSCTPQVQAAACCAPAAKSSSASSCC